MKTIYLDAKINSDLDWRVQLDSAVSYEKIVWSLDLGLSEDFLLDELTFQSLRLGLAHFVEKVWEPLGEKTEEVLIYQGPINSKSPVEHLVELIELLPDDIPVSACVTTDTVPTLSEKSFVLSSNKFGRIIVNHDVGFNRESNLGVLIPFDRADLTRSLNDFLTKVPAIRLVSEAYLTLEWDGLDELYIFHNISPIVKRKVQGFIAAGGVVHYESN